MGFVQRICGFSGPSDDWEHRKLPCCDGKVNRDCFVWGAQQNRHRPMRSVDHLGTATGSRFLRARTVVSCCLGIGCVLGSKQDGAASGRKSVCPNHSALSADNQTSISTRTPAILTVEQNLRITLYLCLIRSINICFMFGDIVSSVHHTAGFNASPFLFLIVP